MNSFVICYHPFSFCGFCRRWDACHHHRWTVGASSLEACVTLAGRSTVLFLGPGQPRGLIAAFSLTLLPPFVQPALCSASATQSATCIVHLSFSSQGPLPLSSSEVLVLSYSCRTPRPPTWTPSHQALLQNREATVQCLICPWVLQAERGSLGRDSQGEERRHRHN